LGMKGIKRMTGEYLHPHSSHSQYDTSSRLFSYDDEYSRGKRNSHRIFT
jgi:hypothetical protein